MQGSVITVNSVIAENQRNPHIVRLPGTSRVAIVWDSAPTGGHVELKYSVLDIDGTVIHPET